MQSRPILRSGLLLAVAAALTSACGSDSTGTNGDNNNNETPTCTVVLSGAQTGSPACTGYATLAKGENDTEWGFDGSATPGISAHVKISGPAATGSYTVNQGSFGTVTVTNGTSTWGTDGNTGTYTLTVTSVSQQSDSQTLTQYLTHGTLTATLPPLPGTTATGNVTMTITF
jgi:hypothetical protein